MNTIYLQGFVDRCISLGMPIEFTKQAFSDPVTGTIGGVAIGTIIDQLYNRAKRKEDEEVPTLLKSLSRGGAIGGLGGFALGGYNKLHGMNTETRENQTNYALSRLVDNARLTALEQRNK